MIAVVIPCYRGAKTILGVINDIPSCVDKIYVVDDACPEQSGQIVLDANLGPRVEVLFHPKNRGVGGAMITGFRAAVNGNAEILVKVDSDGQMDCRLIPWLVKPIKENRADFAKGNRFFNLNVIQEMPKARLFGNAILSFVNKASSGYWDIMDPTNGFFAIHRKILRMIPIEKLDQGYFFESDLLFRLGSLRTAVVDIPMDAKYFFGGVSSMSLTRVAFQFPVKYAVRIFKRLFYNYFLRDFNIGSLSIVIAAVGLSWAIGFGGYEWLLSLNHGLIATSGTVMLAGLPVILSGIALVVFFVVDFLSVPKIAIHTSIPDWY